MGTDVHEIDITREPPSREFLERHIDPDRFLEFVSTRSPVFKERRLPRSKVEAIDLMMKNPNLIKRPIMIKGSNVIFGFDRERYKKEGR
jgi:arsenate reductase-like glutaredoxin family protein